MTERPRHPHRGIQFIRRDNQERALGLLSDLLKAQKEELGKDGTIPWLRNSNLDDIFGLYIYTRRFARLEQEVKKLTTIQKKSFLGKCFQDIAYLMLSHLVTERKAGLLLSPETTLTLYSRLYPENYSERHKLGLSSLRNVSVPDGVILSLERPPLITASCEYTLCPNEAWACKLRGLKIAKEKFPNFFAKDVFLAAVVPSGYQTRETNLPEDIQLFKLNFTGDAFGAAALDLRHSLTQAVA